MESKNIVVFDTGDVYSFSQYNLKPSEWMADNDLSTSQITFFQGPLFVKTTTHNLHDIIEDDFDRMFEWLYCDNFEMDRDLINGTQNASVEEFLSLVFPTGLLIHDFDGVMESVHQVHNTWMDDEYGVSDDNTAVLNGLVEIDWDEVASNYDSDSGKTIFEGKYVVYIMGNY